MILNLTTRLLFYIQLKGTNMLLIIYFAITFPILTTYLLGLTTELLQEGKTSFTLVEFIVGLVFILTPVFNAIFLVACLEGMVEAVANQVKKIKFKQT